MKLEICTFSGFKIYPGKGKIFVRQDNRSFRLINGKVESLFLQRKNPRKIHWTVSFRRMHKKGITEEVAKKRTRRTVKYQRAIVGASVEQIKAKRNQKPEEREKARLTAIQKAKEQKKVQQDKKKAERPKQAQKPVKNLQKNNRPTKSSASSKR